jgi:hypothetical protein
MFSIVLSFTQMVELSTFDGEGKAAQRVQISFIQVLNT